MIDSPTEVPCVWVWAQNKLWLFLSPPPTFLPVLSHLASGAYRRSLFKRSFRLKWRIKINALPRPTQALGEKVL